MSSRGSMSHVDHVDCLRLTVTVIKDGDGEIIQDMSNLKAEVSRFDNEQNVSEADEPETSSDKNFTSGSCSGSDSEVDSESEEASLSSSSETDEDDMSDPLAIDSESEEASLSSSSESDEDDVSDPLPLAMASEPQDYDNVSLEPRSSIIVSSNMDLESIDDNLYHCNDLVGSSDFGNLAQEIHSNMSDEITEGFKRVKELVAKLMNVETTETKIEANNQFVKGLLKQLSFDSESDLDESSPIVATKDQKGAEVSTCEGIKSVIRKKEVWITKCEANFDTFSESVSGNEQHDDSLESEEAVHFNPPLHHPDLIPSSDLHSTANINSHPSPSKPNVSTSAKTTPVVKVVFCSRSPNVIPMISSAAIKTTMSPTISSIHSDSFSSAVEASFPFDNVSPKPALHPPPTCNNTTNTASASSTAQIGSFVPAPAITASVTPSRGDKCRYELIREDIIAERNAQLKAMGFFEDFAELRLEMKPKNPSKGKKKSPEPKEKCERGWVRRSERIFLSSPEVDRDQVSSNCKTTSDVVKEVIEEIITSVCKDRIFPDDGELYQIRCDECGRKFKKKKYLKEHIERLHRKNLNFECNLCDFKTYRYKNMKIHKKVVHHTTVNKEANYYTAKVKKCDQCEYETIWGNLERHKSKAHKEGFPRENSFLQTPDCHDKKVGKITEIESDTDSVIIFTDDSDDDVIPASTVTETHPCVSKDEEKGTGEEKIWYCKTCRNVFKQRRYLKIHERRGNCSLIYKCDFSECDFTTCNKGSSSLHKKKHLNSKKIKCSECDFVTWNNGNLFLHKKKHSKNEFLKCSECDFVTRNKGNLFLHKKKHTNDTLKCSECDLVSPTYYELQKHKCLVHNIGKLNCQDCSFSTFRNGMLKRHRSRKHPEKLVIDSSFAVTE